MPILVSENTDGIPDGDIGLRLRAREGCLAGWGGGDTHGLAEGMCQSGEAGESQKH